MDTYVLIHLRRDARAWWHNRQLRERGQVAEARRRERESVRQSARSIREAAINDGFMTIGRGGNSLHISANRRLEFMHPGMVEAVKAAGIPWADSRPCEYGALAKLIIGGPVPRAGASTGTGPMDYTGWRDHFDRLEKIGAVVCRGREKGVHRAVPQSRMES